MQASGQHTACGPDEGGGPSDDGKWRPSVAGETAMLALALMVLGLLVVWGSSGLRMGTIGRMGPGYFPLAIGILLVLTGAAIAITERGVAGRGEGWDLRGLLLLPLAVAAFGLILPRYGLLAACAVAVVIGRFALSSNTWAGTLLLTALLPLLIYAIFIRGLGLPLPVLPS